jgi:hypothetical protein
MELSKEISPKNLNRKQRLEIAKSWAKSVVSSKKIKAYQKHFGVDKLCAAKELTLAGVELSEKYAKRWATRIDRKKANLIKKRKPKLQPTLFDSDETFYFIAGYTPGGFPYGITWEQAESDGLLTRAR